MPSIRPSYLFTAMAISLALAGCGDKNEKTVFNPEAGHSSDWAKTHKTAAQANIESCGECHGVNLDGGIAKVGCFSTPQTARNGFACHASSPAVNAGCTSCHSTPPTGTTGNGHAKHLALVGVTCDTCHSGGGSGTANHAKGIATVSFPATLIAKTLSTPLSYDSESKKCSGIICHGGLVTPKWDSTAAIGCLECHGQGTGSKTPQYNSYYSGQWSFNGGSLVNLHQLHNLEYIPRTSTRITCTHCHNAPILSAQHFTGLTTPAFEVTAASTVGGSGTLIDSYTQFTSAVPSGSCTSACHSVIDDNPRYWISP